MAVVYSLFVFDPVNEEVDGTVEGGQKMTQTGDKLHPVWPEFSLTLEDNFKIKPERFKVPYSRKGL